MRKAANSHSHTDVLRAPLSWYPRYYTNGRCQKWGKLKYVSDQAPVIHVSYPTDECDTYKPDGMCGACSELVIYSRL